MYLNKLNGTRIIIAKVRRLVTPLCTAAPISINACTGIPNALPYAGRSTNAFTKHASTVVPYLPLRVFLSSYADNDKSVRLELHKNSQRGSLPHHQRLLS